MAVVLVGMADWKVTRAPDSLTTLGLGSCVGVTMLDKARGIGGLAHIMLPSSEGYTHHNRMKFANTGLADMLEALIKMGASRTSLVAKMAGGAHMFQASGTANVLKVGERNIEQCRKILMDMHIPILVSECGGTYGRTIELYTDSGQLRIKTVGFGEKFV